MYGAALYRLRPQDFGELKHVDGVSPAWPLSYDDFEPWYTKAEWLYQVHGNHGEDPTEGTWSKQYPWPAVSHEPQDPAALRRPDGGRIPPVPRAVRDPARRGATARRARASGARGATAIRASSTRSPTPRSIAVRPVLDIAERDAARERRGHAARDRCRRAERHERGRLPRRRAEETYEADIVALSAGATNSAKILLASANDTAPERTRERLRPGRAELHVPQQQGGGRAVEGAERHRLPEDARRERLLLRRRRLRLPGRHRSRWSASPTPRR